MVSSIIGSDGGLSNIDSIYYYMVLSLVVTSGLRVSKFNLSKSCKVQSMLPMWLELVFPIKPDAESALLP